MLIGRCVDKRCASGQKCSSLLVCEGRKEPNLHDINKVFEVCVLYEAALHAKILCEASPKLALVDFSERDSSGLTVPLIIDKV